MKKHIAVYGKVKILRGYCGKCKGTSLIKDNKFLCCDNEVEKKLEKKPEIIVTPYEKRRRPSGGEAEKILTKQNDKCLYCGNKFGSIYLKNSKLFLSKLNWDHLIPYSYNKENKGNFVATCNICNSLKSNKMFDTVEEVYHYVRYMRKKKGIEFLDDVSLPSVQE